MSTITVTMSLERARFVTQALRDKKRELWKEGKLATPWYTACLVVSDDIDQQIKEKEANSD